MGIKIQLPFHVKNALFDVSKFKQQVDLIISVADSRSPSATDISSDLSNIFKGIKILNLFSKSDLSSQNLPNSFNFSNSKSRKPILKLINLFLKSELERYDHYDYSPHFQILVIGLPNVGKSALINLLKNKSISTSINLPGVTRKIINFYLGNNIWIYDSPGIFFRSSNSKFMSNKLFLLNAIPTFSGDYSDIMEYAYNYLSRYFPDLILSFVGQLPVDYDNFLHLLAERFKLKLKGGELNMEQSQIKFLNLIRKSKVFWDYE